MPIISCDYTEFQPDSYNGFIVEQDGEQFRWHGANGWEEDLAERECARRRRSLQSFAA